MEQQEMDFYISVRIRNGAVVIVEPKSSYTDAANTTSIGKFLNKMAEYGYRLVPGLSVPTGEYDAIIFMQRGE